MLTVSWETSASAVSAFVRNNLRDLDGSMAAVIGFLRLKRLSATNSAFGLSP